MKPIAVIILNWNGAKLLREYLPSVVANTNSEIADVIVADNGSTDDSRAILHTEFPDVKVIEFEENYGFAEGYNKAIKLCEAYPYTVLLNSDVETPANWLEPMYEHCEANASTLACQPKILAHKRKSHFEYAGAAGGFIDCNGYPFCRGRIFADVEEDKGQYDDITDIFWATGAALFIRTEAYLRVGGLDKDFFAHMEEIDLCWRIHLLGGDIKVIPQAIVYHLGGGSLPAENPKKTYLNFRNNLLLLHKNLPKKDGKKKLIVRRLYDTLAWVKFMITFDFANANAILRAHRDFVKMRNSYVPTATENLLNTFPESNRNIVLDYYLRGKKKF